MACCVFTAYVMNRIIKACEVLDIKLIDIQYNEFDDDIEAKINGAKTTTVTKFSLEGMTCGACVSTIEDALNALHGIEAVSVSLSLARATIMHDENLAPISQIITTIQNAGYDAQEGQRSAQQNLAIAEQRTRLSSLRTSFTQAMTLSTLMVSSNSLLSYISGLDCLNVVVCALVGCWVQMMIAKDLHRSAWNKRCLARPNMDLLISSSIILGIALAGADICIWRIQSASNYLTSGSFLVAVVLGGRYIRALLERQTATSLAQLYDMQAKTIMVKVTERDTEVRLPALALRPGQEIVLDPGSIISCDCYIISGRGLVDESSMTGESLPRACEPGDFLMSGTRVLGSSIVAIVSQSQENSALEQLISSISTATESTLDARTDMLTTYFVRIILLLAMFTFTTAFLKFEGGFLVRLGASTERAMAVLASACPCALGLATPSAVLSGISVAWSKGIIFTSGMNVFHKLASLTHLVMDKTGTLTTGQLSISTVYGQLLPMHHILICAAEKADAPVHPVARAVFKWALSHLDEDERKEHNNLEILEQRSEPGKGVKCKLSNGFVQHDICIGTMAYLEEHDIQINEILNPSCTSGIFVRIAIDGHHIVSLKLQDMIRPEAPGMIDYLKHHLSLHLAMLTGDSQEEAARVSSTLAIPVISSRALPQTKHAFIQNLQTQSLRNRVAMIGDGVNDTPALSAADVGILLSPGLSRSTRMCVQAADVVLANPNLGGLVEAILIARMTEQQIKINRWWALCYNFVAVALSMGVFEEWGLIINASMAGTLMAGSSISVVALSLLLRARLQRIDYRLITPMISRNRTS